MRSHNTKVPNPVGLRQSAGSAGRIAGFLLLACLLFPSIASADNRILVDTRNSSLSVLDGDRTLLVIDNIAIGRFGASKDKTRGDGRTPVGTYRVTSIKRSKRFHFFIELDYPSVDDATSGLKKGILTRAQADAIRSAHARGKMPPQNTPLGGHIGLHGIGGGDPAVHERYNWTRGCIAVTDNQLDRLLPLIRVGTKVEIR